MAITAECTCGKKFQAKDEYEGRRAICPACRREFIFQAAGIPVFEELPASAPVIPPIPIEGDDDPCQPESEGTAARRLWKDPVIVIGAAVPSTILLVFFVYLFHEHRTKAFHRHVYALKLEVDNLAKSGQSRAALDKCEEILGLVGDSTKADVKMRGYADVARKTKERLRVAVQKSIEEEENARRAKADAERRAEADRLAAKARVVVIPTSDMQLYAEKFAELNIVTAIKRIKGLSDYKITELSVSPHDGEARKIPWLWEATANVSLSEQPDKSVAPVRVSMTWRFLYQFRPDSRGSEYWREVTSPLTGETSRTHFEGSEWTEEFRSTVTAKWTEVFQQHGRDTRTDRTLTAEQKRADLNARKESLCESLNISREELQEILETTE